MSGQGPQIEGTWTPTKEMTSEQLVAEVEAWRRTWEWTCEDARYYLTKVGQACRVYTRNYKGHFGVMLQPIFRLEELDIGVQEKDWDHATGKYVFETKTMRLPASAILTIEFLSERKLWEDVDEEQLLAQTLLSQEGE